MTDFRYTEQAEKQCKGYKIIQQRGSIIEEVADQVKKLGVKKLGFEEEHVTFSTYQSLEKQIRAELVPFSGEIEKLRLIKNEAEIKILKEAAEIADAAYKHILVTHSSWLNRARGARID